MKKLISLLLLVLIIPMIQVKADTKIIIACDEGLTQTSGSCQKQGAAPQQTVTYYVGVDTTTGFDRLEGKWTLTNLDGLKSVTVQDGWTNVNGKNLNVLITSATQKTGKVLIAAFTFAVPDNGQDCKAVFEPVLTTTTKTCQFDSTTNTYYGKSGNTVDQATYNKECNACRIENGKYYGKEGTEVTKEAYDKECSVENPKTGISAPYIAFGAGAAVIALLYFGLRKKGSVYKI